MSLFEIHKYTAADKEAWNAFVAESKNGTFLFDRNYMDYHHDRFNDNSLMFYAKDKLYAILPANRCGDCLCSHGGLTYGGLVMTNKATASEVLALFEELNAYLRGTGIGKVRYKAIPWIYHHVPAEEDLYAIFKTCNAQLVGRDISSSIIMSNKPKWHHGRKYGITRCRKNGVTIQQSDDYAAFWQILQGNLQARYGVRPVHTLDEMLLLKSRFPDNIQLYTAQLDGRVIGGTVLYLTGKVLHTQYISSTSEGKHLGAVDALFDCILNKDYANYPIFDFGKSTEGDASTLNESLIYQKEGFGGRGVCYDTYEWRV